MEGNVSITKKTEQNDVTTQFVVVARKPVKVAHFPNKYNVFSCFKQDVVRLLSNNVYLTKWHDTDRICTPDCSTHAIRSIKVINILFDNMDRISYLYSTIAPTLSTCPKPIRTQRLHEVIVHNCICHMHTHTEGNTSWHICMNVVLPKRLSGENHFLKR